MERQNKMAAILFKMAANSKWLYPSMYQLMGSWKRTYGGYHVGVLRIQETNKVGNTNSGLVASVIYI